MIDTHTHLNDAAFDNCRDETLRSAVLSGVKNIIDVGWDLPSSIKSADFAEKNECVYFAAGVHPSNCETLDNDVIDRLCELLKQEKAVGLGEIGLDYHYGKDNVKEQKDAFAKQIEIACKLKKPFIVHSREASKDVVDIISAHRSKIEHGFLMHCYSESRETAKTYLDLGGYFAFGGAITFKNAKKEEIIRYIPKDRIMCETDCPYMAPVPLRGTVNNPSNVALVYSKTAEILNCDLQEFIFSVRENVLRLFTSMKR